MLKQKDEYNEPMTIVFPQMIARVYSPILDTEERNRRMKIIHRATASILKKGVSK
jgi:hypothetical protein